ncbi:cephalosporin hydroxylase family protein [Lyngbya aestuarii BL J]|uniref:Cephalosporin hydroxylase family protein n=1 Tax=Lyngbya aestuarii BL J TaxID=1348334 RepID=U7QHQ9_9CYAN|nr:CmcI family methyltransferase [Lyngbya aestuarii]ERT06620.1 cephalosporin hydroxylase family protein [Lyngbya aestuarii BL J]
MQNLEATLQAALTFYQAGDDHTTELVCCQILESHPDYEPALNLLGKIRHHSIQQQLSAANAGLAYHLWYYNQQVWTTTTWAGVKALKSPCDLWNYQEIIFELKPSLILEFGTYSGGATLFFASLLDQMSYDSKILSIDIDHHLMDESLRHNPRIELMLCSSISPQVSQRISQLRQEFPGSVFAILDSNHEKNHVFQEMLLLRSLLNKGDYLIVEDGNINGHPVLPEWGEGPYEAIEQYVSLYPNDYELDRKREDKFGFTFAPKGFLIRC